MTFLAAGRNIIQKQYLHVDFNGTESEGFALQKKLSELCTHRLTPAIERVLDRYSPLDEHISIENFRLDIEPLNAAELERELPGLVVLALERELYRLSSHEKSSGYFSEGVRRTTATGSIEEAFIYFLKTGTLPWSFSARSELPFAALTSDDQKTLASSVPLITNEIDLEKMILSAWENTGNSGRAPLDNRNEIARELAGDAARKRLVRQFSPGFLTMLLSLLSPEGSKQVEKALSAIRRLHMQSGEIAAFERLVWETAFSLVATGGAFSAWDIITGTHFSPALGRKQLKSAIKILHRDSPESAIPEELDEYTGSTGSGNAEPDAHVGPELHRLESDRRHHNVEAESRDASPAAASPQQSGISPAETAKHQAHRETGVSKSRTVKANAGDLDLGAKSKHVSRSPRGIDNLNSSPSKGLSKIHGKLLRRTNVRRTGTSRTAGSLVPHRSASSVERETHPETAEGLYIGNAGLVVLHPFLLQFFAGLGIGAGNDLIKPERAICLLHYLATGSDVAPEYDLVLPKVMCGVSLTEPVESRVDLTATEKAEAETLLQTVIRHWDALRNTSPDGLRSAFLLRQGKIALKEAGWLLHVEPKGFDILLGSLPWGISMVKLPWMNTLLHVEW